eukprot:TRINITY_DN5597_c0_g1_i1.p1 TRINITY_DN5597_c0_g1~~TRINITY_DN5597_c0_g1_i1.p1  ORF type:complete len:383 (-),score=66.94 TRINITY_DN5597_c0_g1_i1:1402-2550(-)
MVETYAGLVEALGELGAAADGVFAHISGQVEAERARLHSCDRPTVVHAAAKFPVEEPRLRCNALLVTGPITVPLAHPVVAVASRKRPAPYHANAERSTLCAAAAMSCLQEEQWLPPRSGLGLIPENLGSIADLVLFNSDATPYETYKPCNNLTAVLPRGVPARHHKKWQSPTLGEAPFSLTTDYFPLHATKQFEVAPPEQEAAPKLVLPVNLPLSNMAKTDPPPLPPRCVFEQPPAVATLLPPADATFVSPLTGDECSAPEVPTSTFSAPRPLLQELAVPPHVLPQEDPCEAITVPPLPEQLPQIVSCMPVPPPEDLKLEAPFRPRPRAAMPQPPTAAPAADMVSALFSAVVARYAAVHGSQSDDEDSWSYMSDGESSEEFV